MCIKIVDDWVVMPYDNEQAEHELLSEEMPTTSRNRRHTSPVVPLEIDPIDAPDPHIDIDESEPVPPRLISPRYMQNSAVVVPLPA
jgi:hypothetical protein